MTISTSNIKYMQQPSQGSIEIVNKIPQDYSLVKNTKLVTDDGRQFLALADFVVPQGTQSNPGKVVINIKAMEQDSQ